MVVVQVHKQSIEVGLVSLETLLKPGIFAMMLLLPRDPPDVAQEIGTALRQRADVHAELSGLIGRQGGGQVAGGHDVLDLGMSLRKVGNEVHFFPAVFFLAFDPRKAKTFEGRALHEVEGSICVGRDVLAGLS